VDPEGKGDGSQMNAKKKVKKVKGAEKAGEGVGLWD